MDMDDEEAALQRALMMSMCGFPPEVSNNEKPEEVLKLDANEVNKESVVEEEEEVPVIEKTISEEDIKTVSQWTYENDTALVRWVNDLTDKGHLENGLLSVEDLLCDKE